MKTTMLMMLVFSPLMILAQVRDDFSDGDFSANPVWTGDVSQFEVNSAKQLHLKSGNSDTSCLSTRDSLYANTEWCFWLKLSFNTSANNHVRVYLLSDRPVWAGPLNGYFVQVGGANDSVSLVHQTGDQMEILTHADGLFTGNSVNAIRFRIILDSLGIWKIWADPAGGTNYHAQAVCSGNKPVGNQWFGLFAKYTISNATKVYFDDLYIGPERVDSIAPTLLSARFLTPESVSLIFSENLNPLTAVNSLNYRFVIAGHPESAFQDSIVPDRVQLILDGPVISGYRDTLLVTGIRDLSGNQIPEIRWPVSYYLAKSYDILIHEIMADPDPSGGLPPSEYVELFNRSGYPVSLDRWTFEFGNSVKTLPDIVIQGHGYLILAKGTPFSEEVPSLDLFTAASSLSNDGSVLTLKNENGRVVHTVGYSLDWFGNSFKEDGGWSLEMVDSGNPCGCSENWLASIAPSGGTPGSTNSVAALNPDTISPFLLRGWFRGDRALDLLFSETMDSTTLQAAASWRTRPTVGIPDSLCLTGPDFRMLRLFFSKDFSADSLYRIEAGKGPRDCTGNELDTTRICLAGVAVSVRPKDLVINEILHDPQAGGERFIELFNRSTRTLDLAQMALSSIDSVFQQPEDLFEITSGTFLLFPGDYVVLSMNPDDIIDRYHTPGITAFVQVESLPSMPDDGGLVALVRKNDQTTIDQVNYRKEMHFPLLNCLDGVSLERISPEGFSGDETNWHSASSSCGYATPGMANSQYRESRPEGADILIEPMVFSPDNDGRNDLVTISLHVETPGMMANGFIFSSSGRRIIQLSNSDMIGSKLSWRWDGTDQQQRVVAPGIYIVFIEMFDASGKTEKLKRTVVLSYPH